MTHAFDGNLNYSYRSFSVYDELGYKLEIANSVLDKTMF